MGCIGEWKKMEAAIGLIRFRATYLCKLVLGSAVIP